MSFPRLQPKYIKDGTFSGTSIVTGRGSDANRFPSRGAVSMTSLHRPRKSLPTYKDPSMDYGFNIATRIGKQDALLHPSSSAFDKLRIQFDLGKLSTNPKYGYREDGITYYRVPKAVSETQATKPARSDSHGALADMILARIKHETQDNAKLSYYMFHAVDPESKRDYTVSVSYHANKPAELSLSFTGADGKSRFVSNKWEPYAGQHNAPPAYCVSALIDEARKL